jgi:hypothetical protein
MATLMQQLGGWIIEHGNVDVNRLKRFHDVGGRWVIPVLFGDDSQGPTNIAEIEQIKAKCAQAGVRCGGWFNGWGEPAGVIAPRFCDFAIQHRLQPFVLDLEFAYKNENAPKMPELLLECRRRMPARAIAVTSFGFFDRAMIWNGRTLTPPQSFYDLKVRAMPQHYTQYDAKYAATYCMEDLKQNGPTDFNIADPSAPGKRGVPLPYVHGVLEATGMDPVGGVAASLRKGLADLTAAKQHGFTYGFSVYTLENVSDEDFNLLAAERGKLFLV